MWGYTLRQLSGHIALADKRRRREMANQLSMATLAARGKPKAVKEQIKKLGK